jgi:hypothetical protein
MIHVHDFRILAWQPHIEKASPFRYPETHYAALSLSLGNLHHYPAIAWKYMLFTILNLHSTTNKLKLHLEKHSMSFYGCLTPLAN